jgi:1-acyl-sn-glycerol-3-phosphate acyltransferase
MTPMATGKETAQREPRAALVPLPRPDDDTITGERLSDVDEWGRSEHMRSLARKIYAPLYKHWFRVEWEGLEKIPKTGGALLVANHAGAIPSDAPVIMHGIEEELGRPSTAWPTTSSARHRGWGRCGPGPGAYPPIPTTPAGSCVTRVTSSSSSPKARRGRPRPTPTATASGASVAAASSRSPCGPGVPVIPIAVVGAEESMPILFRIPQAGQALGVPYFPVTANMMAFGPLGLGLYFPAKFKLRVLDPVTFNVPPAQERYSKSRVMEEAETSACTSRRPSTKCCANDAASGSADTMGRRVLITGSTASGEGRMAQALESDPEVEMILGMGTREPSVALERTEFVRADQTYSILSRIVRATQVDTIVHTFLVVDSTRASGRALHEINVIGTMNLLAAAGQTGSPVRQVVVKSSTLVYGSAVDRPGVVPRGDVTHVPGPHPGRDGPCSRSRASSATSPRTTRPPWSPSCASPTSSAPTS